MTAARRTRVLLLALGGVVLVVATYAGALSYRRHRAWSETRARLLGRWESADRGMILDFGADGALRMLRADLAGSDWREERWRTVRFDHRGDFLTIDGVRYTFRFLDDGALEVTGNVGVPRVYRPLDPDR